MYYHNSNKQTHGSVFRPTLLLCLCLFTCFLSVPAMAQVVIGGDVYGGGKQGAVNSTSDNATSVTIHSGSVRTVFGGGQEGAVSGNTQVVVSGGEIGGNQWNGSIHGGVFGAGDGMAATVKGISRVSVSGGTIHNNVYGGGNQAKLIGSTEVVLQGGNMWGDVYAGARMADIEGRTFVNIDGANATNSLIIRSVYGGNDISGDISGSADALPIVPQHTAIDNTWNAIVYATPSSTYPVFVASLYGSGNGDYNYSGENNISLKKWDEGTGTLVDATYSTGGKPQLNKTYIELNGGIYGQVYGGGNFATVNQETVIYTNNSTNLNNAALNRIPASYKNHLALFDNSGYHIEDENMVFDYHVNRMFGGNNKEIMSIRPTWNLQSAAINNLYSGGNRGAMTYPNGIFLALQSANISVNNVYGGCRMADVNPNGNNGVGNITAESLYGYAFDAGYAARVYITDGKINNVYGGNDISGKVYYGTNVEIHASIQGDVYGGGNGSYVYTNIVENEGHAEYGDYYYHPGTDAVDALFYHRPHVEKTLVHVAGMEDDVTMVSGNIYCGGNSATLYKDGGSDASAILRLGNYVDLNAVFLGSNGANMIDANVLTQYDEDSYSSLTLTNEADFERYMDAVAVNILPKVEWDNNLNYSTFIGSFYCGGNVGSMTYNKVNIEFPQGITIYDKIVAGCNSANVIAGTHNAAYVGGLIGDADSEAKVKLLVRSRLEPRTTIDNINYQDFNGSIYNDKQVYTGANIYGGCYNSGVVIGDVRITVEDDLISPNLNSETITNTGNYVYASALAIYGGGYGANTTIQGNTTINLNENARVLLAFGGGQMGEVDGNAQVTLDEDLVLPGDKLNAHRVYAGGYAGEISGNTTLQLLGGGVKRAFAGACNANINGYTAAYIGSEANYDKGGLPYVAEAVFGGNDFGGQIIGNHLWMGYDKQQVRSQSYVQYLSGDIFEGIYGGSYGSYLYTDNSLYPQAQAPLSSPTFKNIPTKEGNELVSNTFVDIASQSHNAKDIIGSKANANMEETTMAAGGGRGYANLPDEVKVAKTYVLLRAATVIDGRTAPIAHRIYGGGNLSTVGDTHVDAYTGNVNMIFGGTHGVKTLTNEDQEPYNVQSTLIKTYNGLDYANMNIFGAGANSGSNVATIYLSGGIMNDVHGGAYTEGYTPVTNLHVPDGSTVRVNAIYGGGLGEEEGRPCDVGVSNIEFASAQAKVEDAIYGGNHTARVTTQSNITISTPVRNFIGELRDVYGAGYGVETVSGFTKIDLTEGALVANVFGGGREGRVLNHYSHFGGTVEGSDAVIAYYSAASERHGNWKNGSKGDITNTLINIHTGAIVNANVYGGGEGSTANVSGETYVNLIGGSVKGDMYGGGYEGPMLLMTEESKGKIDSELEKQNIETLCAIGGGDVRNVFGGGYQGKTEGNTNVTIGISGSTNFYNGKPTILRSVYGGGEMAEVTQTSKVDMYNGYVGYYYDAAKDDFVKNLDLRRAGDKLLKGNGNLFGAGYGIGAVVMDAQVNLWDGVIRNGLYGGAEIATVGKGRMKQENERSVLDEYIAGGKTQVRMYGGKVEGDVFGGGRGFSYDLSNNVIEDAIYYTSGYVFGKTDVEIYRGTIGTTESLAEGQGNVFGGGNIGYVYGGSATARSVVYTGDDDAANAKYKGHYYLTDQFKQRSEDCRVHIEARCLVLNDVTINDSLYTKGSYVLTKDLNTLTATDTRWNYLDSQGLTIRNAVFAGGNVSSGSDKIYANAVTVYGNATAAVVDVFSKDFIMVGDDGVGGLYGDGNLTFVDGYRELNITNYGTDFYNLTKDLSYDDYLKLSDREKGFYNLLYSPKSENIEFTFDGVTYRYFAVRGETPADEIDEHEYKTMLNAYIQMNSNDLANKWTFDAKRGMYTYTGNTLTFHLSGTNYTIHNGDSCTAGSYDELFANYKLYIKQGMEAKWDINGECSLTAGRMLNTIQRADFCGMFGSRIMLYGAQDRVPDIVDYTQYTINRVEEVSLNQRKAPYDTTEIHGNYFGIYNVVNLLGAITSDVEFTDAREADGCLDAGLAADGSTRYLEFKYERMNERSRNMASSKNMVAQASGVFLELVKEKDKDGNKTYGPITGVVQLDLINVKPGEGGGYVYAHNEHGTPEPVDDDIKSRQVLSLANTGAISYANFTYDQNELQPLQTSGNFVHPTKRIVDDCFPRGGYYDHAHDGDNYSQAHFWYIRGDFYVYDQYVSGYTGAAQAYEQDIDIPLTIAAGSEGRMTLQSVNPNKYAYFVGKHYGDRVLAANDSILIEENTYHQNDPISYWDWSQLSVTDQSYFVDSTYVAICDAQAGETSYKKGLVLLPKDFRAIQKADSLISVIDINGEAHQARTDSVFRISNEISHNAGYLITFDITNPLEWDNYYTKLLKGEGVDIEKMLESVYLDKLDQGIIDANNYKAAPTLLCTKSGIYGQRIYSLDDVVNAAVFNSQSSISNSGIDKVQEAYDAIKKNQAAFEPAYVMKEEEITFNIGAKEYHMFEGSYLRDSLYNKIENASIKAAFEKAYICINTIEVADKEYILNGDLIPLSRYNELKTQAQDPMNTFMSGKADTHGELSNYFSEAYVCTKAGKYGGHYFEEKKNYLALDFCSLPYEERNAVNDNGEKVFQFNFDAFNLLATDFHPDIHLYKDPYFSTQAVNYTATYTQNTPTKIKQRLNGSDYAGDLSDPIDVVYNTTYQRVDYESILNEKAHYMPIKVEKLDSTYYIVNNTFEKANIYYPVGKVITEDDYTMLSATLKDCITAVAGSSFVQTGTYYYCVEDYKMSSESAAFSNYIDNSKQYSGKGTVVPLGTIIHKNNYNALPNYQTGFTIQGHAPIQTTTIYVPRESDILNLSKDRVITVVYRYDYKEGDGADITNFSEKHIINIHLEFRSGQPTIGDVTAPATVLPNSTVGLSVPSVTKGAYEILGGGWEIFETELDAREHKNGVAYKNNATPMYWYQNNYYVAYYAKTYLGKTYSNPVPFSVANYHRIGEVMNHEQRMFIDHKDVDRASKIYLDAAAYPNSSIAADYDALLSPNGKTDNKNDLDYLYDLYQETKSLQATSGYIFNNRIENAANLEFFLRSDIEPKEYTSWTPVGDEGDCFSGDFHGNGYTIKNMTNSVFGYLCGKVYNLGVMGSFTGGGVADNGGYAENTWVYTTGAPSGKAIIADGGSIINSYYHENNAFAEGDAIKKSKSAFVDGEVAYQLNRFHLHKRYSDKTIHSGEAYKYKYYDLDTESNALSLKEAYYDASYAVYNFGDVNRAYVEDYYADGDFVYANGEVPLENNERFHLETNAYYPIYPDDYIFFGQKLSFETLTHNEWPVHIVKQIDGEKRERIVRAMNTANRVYRAPAYFMNKKMDKTYFNIYAALADHYRSLAFSQDLYVDHHMTALDLSGHNDHTFTTDASQAKFYMPYLDYEGLNNISISDLTPNLLIYADPVNDESSYNMLKGFLREPAFAFDSESAEDKNYYKVAKVNQHPRGHLVDLNGDTYIASDNHFLVDKENFNVPIAYQFDKDHGMWYQRTPDGFANRDDKGWDVICLPFTAQIVTTHEKGEITHFYGESIKNHEYWLREFKALTTGTETTAGFERPDAASGGPTLVVENTFLYDTYYKNQDDDNDDAYQKTTYYAESSREYPEYAYLTVSKPYIVAFPGVAYYEFDMSGQFVPKYTEGSFSKLDKQVVTMISANGVSVAVTDDENRGSEVIEGYQFVGSYQQMPLTTQHHLINAEGNAFEAVTEDAVNNGTALSVPFRGYFVAPTLVRRIHIGGASNEEGQEEIDQDEQSGSLSIYGKKNKIYIQSTLDHDTTVVIYSTSGKIVKRVLVKAGSKVVVDMPSRGIYIVNKQKVSVV